MSDTDDEKDDRDPAPPDLPERVLKADDLFGGRREVWIELEGVRYRLRITRRG